VPVSKVRHSAAWALARELGLPWIGKDALKETLYEELGADEELEPKLDRAAARLLLTIAEQQLASGLSAIVESNFDRDVDSALATSGAAGGTCSTSPRRARRSRPRRAADVAVLAERMREGARGRPLN
jgi:hypothetical protein